MLGSFVALVAQAALGGELGQGVEDVGEWHLGAQEDEGLSGGVGEDLRRGGLHTLGSDGEVGSNNNRLARRRGRRSIFFIIINMLPFFMPFICPFICPFCALCFVATAQTD